MLTKTISLIPGREDVTLTALCWEPSPAAMPTRFRSS